jgi:hypothetical protein
MTHIMLTRPDVVKQERTDPTGVLGNVALSPPADEEDILASVALPYVVTLGHPIPPFLYPSLG